MEQCLAHFDKPILNFYNVIMYTQYMQYMFVYVPVVVADILIIFSDPWET
jgi:hypothetical protein